MRMYDPRVGKFLSVDPLSKKYPWYTPYQYAGNKPVWKRDVDGLEEEDLDADRAEKEELEKNARLEELSRALRFPTQEEQAKLEKDFKEWEKETPKEKADQWKKLSEGLRNYGRNALSSAETIFGGGQTVVTETNSADLQKLSDAQRAAIGGAQATVKIWTPRGIAEQSLTKEALEAAQKVNGGATLYRIGTLGNSNTSNAQYWSLENPAEYINKPEEFAKRYGIPEQNLNSGEFFIETAHLQRGAKFITRPAEAAGQNPGGQIEVVTSPGNVQMETFSVVNPQKI